MPRVDFERELRSLQDDLLMLGSMVEKAITKSVDALKRRDVETSKQVISEDDAIDELRFKLEDRCVEIIATQQPIAKDLRVVFSILHMAVELERMGDYAEGIAKIGVMIGQEPPLKPLIDIPIMADKAVALLRRSLNSFLNRDVEEAKKVCRDDDDIDNLYDQVYRELLLFMIQDPKTIQRATYLLWVAHDLERTADRATNIAERVIYMVTGKMSEIASKY